MKPIVFHALVLLTMATLSAPAAARTLFPFYDDIQTDQGAFFAVRPFYSHTVVGEGQIHDYLWPLYSRKEFKDEQTSRALMVWWTHTFDAQEQNPRERNWLLPIYFQGRDINDTNYVALFPVGGTIREFLGRDEIQFLLFPLFAKSRMDEVKTTSVLWPIYSHTRGPRIERDRVFPICGRSSLEEKYEKRFILWPFWTSADYFYPGDSGTSWILFPLCGRGKLERESTWWWLPPFFRFTEGVKQDKLFCPWPFIQKIKSEPHSRFYLWPLWGEDQYAAGPTHRAFMLWPLLWSEKTGTPDSMKIRRMALPFFYQESGVRNQRTEDRGQRTEIRNTQISKYPNTPIPNPQSPILNPQSPIPNPQSSMYWKLWPLMSWQREGETSRFRMLEFWPLKNSAPIERNWAPLWTLYKRTHQEGVVRKDVLWFAWHSEREASADRKEWSLLKGLLSYKKESDAHRLRILYFINFGATE